MTLDTDFSAALGQRGINVTVLRAGTQKMAANPFEPLAGDTIQRLLVDLEAARNTFADSVGRYRGNRFAAQAALATQAQDYPARPLRRDTRRTLRHDEIAGIEATACGSIRPISWSTRAAMFATPLRNAAAPLSFAICSTALPDLRGDCDRMRTRHAT
ncbi:MAG: hypothetical protein WB500_09935 [Rhodoplanes sp.]